MPAPERYAVHKVVIQGECSVEQRAKATKDLLQAASLISYFLENQQTDVFNAAWHDANSRGKGWQRRARQGMAALFEACAGAVNE